MIPTYFVVTRGSSPDDRCVCGRRGHPRQGAGLVRCLTHSAPGAQVYARQPDGSLRALQKPELDWLRALPAGPPPGPLGRPPNPEGRRYSGKLLRARVSKSEYREAERRAKRLGLSMSDYVRAAALGLLPRTGSSGWTEPESSSADDQGVSEQDDNTEPAASSEPKVDQS